MYQVTFDTAPGRLLDLMEAAIRGEKVYIIKDQRRAVQLVPVEPQVRKPQFGSARGLVTLADDFDDPLPDFDEYMP